MTAAASLRAVAILLLAAAAAVAGGFAGKQLGEASAYAVATLVDREIAELKDMLIWSIVAGMLAGGAAGAWIVLALAHAPRWAQRSALVLVAVLALGGTAVTVAAYDWPKSSGHPVVQYELRLPPGVTLPPLGDIRLSQWEGKSGHGVYIREIRTAGERAEIAGSFVIGRDSKAPMMSLGLARNIESQWRIPIAGDTKLEPAFGPWQRIELLPSPRADTQPLPAGDYDIRYRVRRYM